MSGRMDENAKEMPSGQLFKLASKKAIVCDQKPGVAEFSSIV